jgi:alkanesulfonate monooxygenase SsuD/methylene tetrahydromethanopterin reductase-like flavin-dependent oxidoreductase (luciferase family)
VPPADLLTAVVRAEQAGFTAAMCSDHISPWSERQGESGFAWSWLGAALQATGLTFGVVNAPGQRYHPAIIAQAIGTLGSMYPGRFWAALGPVRRATSTSPGRAGRARRSAGPAGESVDVIRRLLAGEEVSHDGLVTVDRARVWSRPEQPPRCWARQSPSRPRAGARVGPTASSPVPPHRTSCAG